MLKKVFLLFVLAGISTLVFSQKERKYIRQGNDEFDNKNYTNSEIAYRKAVAEDPGSFDAQFNIGDALYKQEKYEEAAQKFSELENSDAGHDKLSDVYHNLGNSLLKSNKLKESIEAYKKALKYDPKDIETKHNLTYAMRKLKQQQQKQNQQKQNKDKNQQQKNDQQQKQNQQDKQNQQNQNQQNQPKPQDQDQQKQNQQQQQQQGKKPEISKEDAERLLQALQNDEKQLQKKLKKKKAAKAQSAKTTKNW